MFILNQQAVTVHLRELSLGDRHAVADLHADPEVEAGLGFSSNASASEAEALITALLHACAAGSARWWAVTRVHDASFIGTCGIHRWSRSWNRCEISFAICRAHRGKGYATAAVQQLINWVDDSTAINRIEACVRIDNISSERVLLRLGFKLEGIQRDGMHFDSAYIDLKQYSLLRREFSKTSSLPPTPIDQEH
ncbi:MAG: hypothetical protein RJB34_499 [Pseudomonadota bacterium]|jgi:ribosomal-protein-alanine N-acetyltransferase